MDFENFRYRHAGRGLDFRVGIGKGQPQPRREPPTDRRLAGSHHSDQHNQTLAQGRDDFGLPGWVRASW